LDNIQVDAQPDTTVILCAPEEVCFTADAGGLPVIWLGSTGDTLGLGTQLCVTPPVGASQYIATADGQCVLADTVNVEVTPDTFDIDITASAETICLGDSSDLAVQLIPDSIAADIVWTLDGVEISTDSETTVSPNLPGFYTYVASARNECHMAIDSVTILVVDSLQIEAEPDTTVLICAPVQDEVCFSATALGLEDGIVWVNPSGDTLGTGATLCDIPAIGESLYIATLPSFGCSVADTVRVLVDTVPPPAPIFTDSIKICLGDTARISVEDGYLYPFTWSDGSELLAENADLVVVPDDVGVFEYIVEARNGCGTVRDTAIVTVVDSSAVQIIEGDLTLCAPDTVTLTADWTYPECVVWTDIAGNMLDTGVQIVIPPFIGADTIIAQVPGLDCVDADTVIVTFLEPPTVEVVEPIVTICEGDTASLLAQVTPESNTNFVSWYDADFNFITDENPLEVSPEAGIYTYIVIAENACGMDTAFAEVIVERLDLELLVTNDTICVDESTVMEVVGCEDCTYFWSPSEDLSAPDSSRTEASPTETTTYTVEVIGQACIETLSTTITVEDCPSCLEQVFVADAFTPNDDRVNDYVCLRSEFLEDFEEVEFMIYNRWGEEMFHSTDIGNLCWDGTHRGKKLPPDVYGYYLRVKCPGRDAVEQKGDITLLR
jgi:gliding motility-associated-like protein